MKTNFGRVGVDTKNSFQFKTQKEFDAHIGVLRYHGPSRCELFSNKATPRFARLRFIFTNNSTLSPRASNHVEIKTNFIKLRFITQ